MNTLEKLETDKNELGIKEFLKLHCVNFTLFILNITDSELKKEKDPNKLFDKYLESI